MLHQLSTQFRKHVNTHNVSLFSYGSGASQIVNLLMVLEYLMDLGDLEYLMVLEILWFWSIFWSILWLRCEWAQEDKASQAPPSLHNEPAKLSTIS